ncbi:MAG: DUF1778 domain-containing protein [Gemmatimonadaceae bacterium]
MTTRSEQLQIRLTPGEKAALKRRASAAGQDVSAYVLARALPEASGRLLSAIEALRADADSRFALAELSDALSELAPTEFGAATDTVDIRPLVPLLQNYVAAMVEQAAARKLVPAPAWTRDVEPLAGPHFSTSLTSVRLYLLRVSPLAFKRRNIFIDASARV